MEIGQSAVLLTTPLAVGALSSALSGSSDSIRKYYTQVKQRVPFAPPASVFGPVWTLLYILMGIAIVLVVNAVQSRGAQGVGASLTSNPLFVMAIGLFSAQLMLNFLWSIVFFRLRDSRGALKIMLLLDVAVAATTVLFFRLKPLSGVLLLPYVAWLSFATYLNIAIIRDMSASPG